MLRRLLVLLVAVAAALLVAGVVRALWLPAPPPRATAVPPLPLDAARLADNLAAAIRVPTVSEGRGAPPPPRALAEFHALLAERFPRVHRELGVEPVGGGSLLIRWLGQEATRKPALFAAHLDVVPVPEHSAAQWRHPPFGGVIADGFIWGRGALDNKSALMAQLEAAERLLADGYRPQRTLYLAFGHDEEIGGEDGAAQIAALLQARGVRLAFTLDEGGAITRGLLAGVDRPVASVMSGEKGYATYRLTARAEGGHSSTPLADGAVVRLARALTRLDAHPMPARLIPQVAAMLDRLAPEMPFGARLLIANRDLLEPLLLRALARGSVTDALIRSTQAFTVLRAGIKDNILPGEAHALINFRLLPGDDFADIERHLRAAIDDPAIEIRREDDFRSLAPPPSDPQAPEFALIERAVQEVFPQAVVASGIILATTDNRHYAPLRDQAYYFAPFPYTPDDQRRLHGVDERIGVEAYADMVRFYLRLFEHAGA